MPRLQPSLFRQANRHSSHLATLLPACRDLQSAVNELRWIRAHVDESKARHKPRLLKKLCRQRGRGVPLQYVLGTQPFGSLDIRCRPGVLIPRSETEAYTLHLADLIKLKKRDQFPDSEGQAINVIDFCSGTGCIPIQLFASLQKSFKQLNVVGVDISPQALQLATENVHHNTRLGNLNEPSSSQSLSITRCDVFNDEDIQKLSRSQWHVLVSNPPYVSLDVWNHGRGQLGYSVRKYEPRLALVPGDQLPRPERCDHADVFYARLLDIAVALRSKLILLEIGDESQARRVLQLYFDHAIAQDSRVELWRDWPDFEPTEDDASHVDIEGPDGRSLRVLAKGSGLIRSIYVERPGGDA